MSFLAWLVLFGVGFSGLFLFKTNLIILLMSIELILLSVNLLLFQLSVIFDDVVGQVFSLFILVVAASEAAVGLSLLVVYYRTWGVVIVDLISGLKGIL